MSDTEEPPPKVTKYDMNNQYLEGEVMEEGQEEWLSEGLLTDDDEYNATGMYNETPNTSNETTLPSLDALQDNSQNETEMSQDGSMRQERSISQERSASQCSEDSEATNASFVLDTGKIGEQLDNENNGGHNDKNIEDKLNNLQKSRDATPDLPDDLDAFLISKADGKVLIAKRDVDTAKQIEELKAKMAEEDDGNDTDDLLRLLEEGNTNKTKKIVKKATKQKKAESSDDENNDYEYKTAHTKRIKAATNALIKKRTPTKAVPEDDDITDASSSDESELKTVTTRNQSKQKQQQQSANNKTKQQNNKQQKKSLPQPQKLLNKYQSATSIIKEPLLQLKKIDIKQPLQVKAKSEVNKQEKNKTQQQSPKNKTQQQNKEQQKEPLQQQQKLLNKYQPKVDIIKQPLLQLQKIDIKQPLQSKTKSDGNKELKTSQSTSNNKTPVQKPDTPPAKPRTIVVSKMETPNTKNPLKTLQKNKDIVVTRTKSGIVTINKEFGTKKQEQTVTKQQKTPQSQPQSSKAPPPRKPLLRFVNTPLEPQITKPTFNRQPQPPKTSAQVGLSQTSHETVTKPPDEEKRKVEAAKNEEIINEKEFMEDARFDLNEQFVKQQAVLKEEEKQRLMKPESMDEEVPTDGDSQDEDEESLYDELPSSESDVGEDWFTIDIRSERAADYLPLLGEKAYEILLDEKKRVTEQIEESRKRLEALTNSGRQQAEQLKKATLALAELDAALGAA